jgi:hypothetical protein
MSFEIDRRPFIASLGGAAVGAGMSDAETWLRR